MDKEKQKNLAEKFGKFHDKHYKHLLLIPIIILIFSFVYMFVFYLNTGDFVNKDISLTGGTSVTIYGQINSEELKSGIQDKLEEVSIREVYNLLTREKIAIIVETKSSGSITKGVLEEQLGFELGDENSSFEFTSSLLSENFYKQLLIAIFFAFLFMAIIVFILFRKIVPSLSVIISAFADILMTLTLVNILGIKMSSAGIVAFLMLIGYSVDTDILLTNRVLKRYEGTLNERIFSAFKTGMTMTLTSLLAITIALVISTSFSVILTQIFTILVIGLGFDILNTWITNVSLIKWYVLKNEV